MKILKSFLVLFTTLLLMSCSEDDPSPSGKYENGVFVVNEGNFGEADGSISFIHDDGTVEQQLFAANNNSIALGDVVQSMHRDGEQIFVVVNNSNKIEVVNAVDFTSVYTLGDLALPRFMTSADGTGYVTEWVSFSDAGRLTVFDLETGEVRERIATGFGAENVHIAGDQIFVSNNFEGTITVIDKSSLVVTDTLAVGPSPGAFVQTGSDLFVICAGGLTPDFEPANDGRLVRIGITDLSFSATSLEMNLSTKMAVDAGATELYLLAGKKLYAYNIASRQLSLVVENQDAVAFYGLGVSPDGEIFVADHNGFTSNGKVYVYAADGDLSMEYTAGRGPNGFLF